MMAAALDACTCTMNVLPLTSCAEESFWLWVVFRKGLSSPRRAWRRAELLSLPWNDVPAGLT